MRSSLLLPFSLGHFANDMAPVGMYLIIPAFGAAMDLSPAEIGLLFTLHTFGAALAYLPAGVLADHVADRGLLLLATFFWVGSGYLVASFAESYWTFALLIAIAGMGDAAWHPIATGVLARLHGNRRAYALGAHAIGGHLAEVFGLLAAGLILTTADWRTATQVLVIPTFVMGLAFILVARWVPRIEASRPTRADVAEVWRVWSSRGGLRVIALFVFYNMAMFATLAMTPVYLEREHGFEWRETAFALAAMLLLGALAQPAVGKVSDAVGRRPLAIVGNAVAAVAAFAAWWFPAVLPTLIALGVALTMLVAIRAVLLAAAVDHAGGREGTSLGLAFVFMDGVAAFAAVLAGIVGEAELSYAFLLASGFALAATTLSIAGREDRPVPTPVAAAGDLGG